jgi:hypothetical protein
MLFTTADKKMWVQTTGDQVKGEYYSDKARKVMNSSYKRGEYTAKWYNRKDKSADPQISVRDHHDCVKGQLCYVYIEGSYPITSTFRDPE